MSLVKEFISSTQVSEGFGKDFKDAMSEYGYHARTAVSNFGTNIKNDMRELRQSGKNIGRSIARSAGDVAKKTSKSRGVLGRVVNKTATIVHKATRGTTAVTTQSTQPSEKERLSHNLVKAEPGTARHLAAHRAVLNAKAGAGKMFAPHEIADLIHKSHQQGPTLAFGRKQR